MNTNKRLTQTLCLTIMAAFFIAPTMSRAEEPEKEVSPQKGDYNDTYKQLNLFGEVFERVRAEYVEGVTDKELIEHALNGMLSNLDPHSGYLSADDFSDMKVETRGEFGGLGIEVTMDNGLVKVVSPIDDTPAFRADIQSGDYIVKIDEEPVMGLSLNEAVDKMRGKVGTPIDLVIRREGEDALIDVTIIRDIIKIKSVRHRVEGNTGYIRITTFNRNSGSGVRNAIKEISDELGDSLIGYVIDLRNNPGGLLSQAIEVSDAFLDKGEIVSQRGRSEEDTERNNATSGDLTNGLPLIVLINSGSASASEIVAGALQDHKRGIIMGTQSFGKGSVQTIIPVPGNGAMRLTTARYYTPSGRSIQAKGVTPDIIVEQAHLESLGRQRVREADLRGALDKQADESQSPANDNKKESTNEDGKEGEEEAEDYQLSRAFDLLSGLALYHPQKEASQE